MLLLSELCSVYNTESLCTKLCQMKLSFLSEPQTEKEVVHGGRDSSKGKFELLCLPQSSCFVRGSAQML